MQIFRCFFFCFFLFFSCLPAVAQEKDNISPETRIKLSTKSRQPNELLRLAYLDEQKENFAQALFYLNLYSLTTHDTEAIPTIEQLAARYRLQGYEHNDFEWLLMKYKLYFPYMLILGLSIWGSILLYWLFVWVRGGKILLRYKALWLLTLFFMAFLFNFYQANKQGIIAFDEVYLMDAPSAGSRLLKVVSKGHRIAILDETNIWYKTRWQGKVAYIRKNCVWELEI
jgi:hypothetical protein